MPNNIKKHVFETAKNMGANDFGFVGNGNWSDNLSARTRGREVIAPK
jgi:hypothetical protein